MILHEVAAAEQIGFPILTVLTFWPLLGAVWIWFFQKDEALLFWHTGGQPALFADKYSGDVL